jgi:hypothetical protein
MIDPNLPNRVAEEAQARLNATRELLGETTRRLELALNAAKFWRNAYDTALKERDAVRAAGKQP